MKSHTVHSDAAVEVTFQSLFYIKSEFDFKIATKTNCG